MDSSLVAIIVIIITIAFLYGVIPYEYCFYGRRCGYGNVGTGSRAVRSI